LSGPARVESPHAQKKSPAAMILTSGAALTEENGKNRGRCGKCHAHIRKTHLHLAEVSRGSKRRITHPGERWDDAFIYLFPLSSFLSRDLINNTFFIMKEFWDDEL